MYWEEMTDLWLVFILNSVFLELLRLLLPHRAGSNTSFAVCWKNFEHWCLAFLLKRTPHILFSYIIFSNKQNRSNVLSGLTLNCDNREPCTITLPLIKCMTKYGYADWSSECYYSYKVFHRCYKVFHRCCLHLLAGCKHFTTFFSGSKSAANV